MFQRFRHRRKDEKTRLRYQEIFLKASDFIWPLFLVEGRGIKKKIASMPGVFHYSIDRLMKDLDKLILQGLESVLLFGVPEEKGVARAYHEHGLVQRAAAEIKRHCKSLEIITDVCLCSFTEDGHCHVGDNDRTCELLARIAVSHAEAGADIVAPSDMMDGRVHYIRKALEEHKFPHVGIMSYAAKYASSFYGPFRDAADCAPREGDRKTYQINPANSREAMEEIAADIEEGARSIIIKPALSYLDIICRARSRFDIPVIAYNVSGEYVMIRQMVHGRKANASIIEEILLSIKRAGADRIISYFTPYLLEKLYA